MDVTIPHKERVPDLADLLCDARDLILALWEAPKPDRPESEDIETVSYRGLRVAMAIVLAMRDRKDVLSYPELDADPTLPIRAEDLRDFIVFAVTRAAGHGVLEARDWKNRLVMDRARTDFIRFSSLVTHIGRTEGAIAQLCAKDTSGGCTGHFGSVDGTESKVALNLMDSARKELLIGPNGVHTMRKLQVIPDARLPFAFYEAVRVLMNLLSAHAHNTDRRELARFAVDIVARLYA